MNSCRNAPAAAVAIALSALSLAGPAVAQTCTVKPPSASWSQGFGPGVVNDFGDLKIRPQTHADCKTGYIDSCRVTVDVKAPNFRQDGVVLVWGQPQKFTICGQEVTITYDNGYINVGVF